MQARFVGPDEFTRRGRHLLLEHEAENNLVLSTAGSPTERTALVLLEQAGKVRAAAAMTSPLPLVVTDAAPETMEELAAALCRRGMEPRSVTGPKRSAADFAAAWAAINHAEVRRRMAMRVFQLEHVNEVKPAQGQMVAATLDEAPLAAHFMQGFNHDVKVDLDGLQWARQAVLEGRFFFWKNPNPVACAAWAGRTPNGTRLNAVYTLPAERNRGYATSLVATVSKHLLGTGRRYCFLYTDADNPATKSLYARVGYHEVCEAEDWALSAPQLTRLSGRTG